MTDLTTDMTLVELMKTNPDGTLEDVARKYNVSLLEVVIALPVHTLTRGEQFDMIWDEVTTWGTVTTLVHNSDVILEFQGELPSGFYRHGYYNLCGKGGLSGHIKAENCHHIAFIERDFMGMATASILFFNAENKAMFKIFLGRDSHRQLLADQVISFRQLAEKLKGLNS